MVDNTKRGIITFSYNSDKLFNDVCLLSAFMTKNLVSEAGSMLDELCITEDEKEIYDECLMQALPNIYEAMIRIAPCSDNAFDDGIKVETETPEEPETKTETSNVKIEIKNNGAYNPNVLTLVDATLNNCIKYGVLVEFYSICVNDGLFGIAKQKFDTNLLQLKQRLFQLKKKSVSSQL